MGILGQTYTVSTGYNTRGELTTMTYPDGAVVGRSYTDRGQLHRLTQAGAIIDTRTYDNGGRLTTDAYNNTVTETRTYNTDNTLASISYNKAIGNMTYGWDSNKNKTSETITGTMANYGFAVPSNVPSNGYDAEDRLVGFNRTAGLTQSWNLSPVGDWNSVTTNGTAQSRTHGPTHELLNGGGSTVSTDVKGNITLVPPSLRPILTMQWDMDNRLTTATAGATTISHQYDALGRRVAHTKGSTTTVFVPSGQQTICDYVAGAAPASSTYRYVYASYIDEPVMRWQTTGGVRVYHRNQQYSITALTSASGGLLERYAYTAYGVPTITNGSGAIRSASAHNNRYTYTGREWDSDLRLYHYRARMYDPSLRRFCSRDPIGYEDDPGVYAYCYSKPVRNLDPSGLKCEPRVMLPMDWSDWQGGSMQFWRPIYGWAWYYEYEYVFALSKKFTDTSFSIGSGSSGRIMHWGVPYGILGGSEIGKGTAISAVSCKISCTDDCKAVVTHCTVSGTPLNRTNNQDQYWYSLANYSFVYNDSVVTFGYHLESGFSFKEPTFDPGIELDVGGVTLTGGFSNLGATYQDEFSDQGNVSYVCEKCED